MDPTIPIPKKQKKVARRELQSFGLDTPIPKLKKHKPTKNAYRQTPSNTFAGGDIAGSRQKQFTKPSKNSFALGTSTTIIRQSKPFGFPRGSHITMLSERPFVLRINTGSVPTHVRSSSRSKKRKSYLEQETNSDFLESDSENETKTVKKRLKKGLKQNVTPDPQKVGPHEQTAVHLSSIDNTLNIEAPPPGVLPSLWYSRESCIHVWVIEKIIGWSERMKVEMEWKDEKIYELDRETSRKVQDKLINYHISDATKRMDISRISPRKCPVVLKAVAGREQRLAKTEEREPNCFLRESNQAMEEVLLIKWRGRSYTHCSWERASDLERLDPTNNTAKGKIKRYYQSQYTALGMNWKRVLENRRKSDASISCIGELIKEGLKDANLTEEFFSPDFLEVERIIACDEDKLDMNVLSKQRELNRQNEKEAEKLRQTYLIRTAQNPEDPYINLDFDSEEWDPEDYVRYVVKWKGVQISEVTWEYWLHIKHDCVDPTHHFWTRQEAPNPHDFELNAKEHPHMREYKKLLTSPIFGLSKCTVLDTSEEAHNLKQSGEDAALRLRDYQLEGVNWLIWNWWNKRSCILADEMGLGKTIQSMAFLDQLQSLPTTQVRGPFLVVAPLSLVSQWQSEAQVWAPDMNVLLYHGSMDARNFLVQQEFYYTDQFISKSNAQKLKRLHVTKFHLLITTYEVAMKDTNILNKIRWKAVIVDEAHRLKNDQSRLFSELRSVPRDFCVLLTGTPLQNSTEELWSLLHFCDPSIFASKEEFVGKFGQLKDSKQVRDLHSILKPYLLRRVKEDVEKTLPPKEETILEVSLTPIQKKYYKAIYERNTSFLFKGSKPSNAPSLMNIMMELRKCCNHPFLIKGAEDRIIQEASAKYNDETTSDPTSRYQKILDEQLVKSSGKMVLLMKLMPKLQAGGHKVLIFSQMVRVLHLLEELLKSNNYKYERLDGSTRAPARNAAVSRFNQKSYKRFVMLLSTRAGGLGLNLTSADTVIIFDSDWNPQNDLQAMARAHRIGQTRAVKVYRLLTQKTYEMHMFHSASMKLGLDRAVLAHQRQQGDDEGKGSSKKASREFQAKEIDMLLKKGAYDVFRDDDDTEGEKFMETDIDQILKRSSRTVTYGNTQSSINNGLGSFSKASFVTADADGQDIDLDDPDFWAKAVGLDAPVEAVNENIVLDGEKRSRKQVQAFDPYTEFQDEEEKKKEKADLKVKSEKMERKRQKDEKRLKRDQEKEVKKRDKETTRLLKTKANAQAARNEAAKSTKTKDQRSAQNGTGEKNVIDILIKKTSRLEQRRVVRALEQRNPIVESMKQGWDARLRDLVIHATLQYGFMRFCKVRNDTGLLHLPIQDIELFTRSFIFQLGLQGSVSLLQDQREGVKLLKLSMNSTDSTWVAQSIAAAVTTYDMYREQAKDLRMPQILTEQDFVLRLREGEAISALKDISFLTRINAIIEQGAEGVLKELGQEELGKRGCHPKDLFALDIDMKVRFLTKEELIRAVGKRLSTPWKIRELSDKNLIAPWWDHSCDLGLIVGTFLKGLGNYQAMTSEPFFKKAMKEKCECTALKYEKYCEISEAICTDINNLPSDRSHVNDGSITTSDPNYDITIKHPFERISAKPTKLNRQQNTTNNEILLNEVDAMCTSNTKVEGEITGNGSASKPHISSLRATDIHFLHNNTKRFLRNVIKTGSQTNDQDSLNSVVASLAPKLDDRLIELVRLIEMDEPPRASKISSMKNEDPTRNDLTTFGALCGALDLQGRNVLKLSSKLEFDDNIAIPDSLSKYGLIAFAYITEGIIMSLQDDHQSDVKIPIKLRENEEFRNAICATLFCLGTAESPKFLPTLYKLYSNQNPMISFEDIKQYIQTSLLPHCALMCITGIGDDRSSKRKFFPDPLFSFGHHSKFSLNIALAILRKTKMHKLVSNITQLPESEFRTSIDTATLNFKDELPPWWNSDCSMKLLHDAAQNGLFHMTLQRHRKLEGMPFHSNYIKEQVQRHFFQDSTVQSYMVHHCSQQDIDDFIERQTNLFPDALVIEKLLAAVCNEISQNQSTENWSFVDLPMPDHGIFQRHYSI